MGRKSAGEMELINMMCVPLYNDLAMVVHNLYENKDEISPYKLFLVSINNDDISVFAPDDSKNINICNYANSQSYWEWEQQYSRIYEATKRSGFRFEPYVTSCKKDGFNEAQVDEFFKNLIEVKHMNYQESWSIGDVYAVFFRHISYKKENLPKQIYEACEFIKIWWSDFFMHSRNGMPSPHISKVEILKEQLHIREMSPYFEIVTRISSISYEKARCNGNISVMEDTVDALLRFDENDHSKIFQLSIENAKQLRKLLEMAKGTLSLLVHKGKTYGIGKSESDKCRYTFCVTGHLEWHINDNKGKKILRYKHGEYYLPEIKEIDNWYVNSKIEDDVVCKITHDLLGHQRKGAFNKGTIIIITDRAEDEVSRLCKKGRGMRINGTSIIEKKMFESVKTLFDIDGAVFLDKEGSCYGIGIILDGEAIVGGTPARGARYNSTKTYISRCVREKIDAYALILSEDGYFNIITSDDKEIKDAVVEEKEREDAK